MVFPDSQRVIYRRNPLEAVICQLRFAPILKIESEVPTAFQEKIRHDYPLFEESAQQRVPQLPAELAKAIGNDLPTILAAMGAIGNKRYEFASEDTSWQVSLNRDFLALTTRRYTRWEDFRARLARLMDALREEYDPRFFVRVGLRYRDVIKKADWGLGPIPWADLLQPHIVGELSSPDIAPAIDRVVSDVLIRLDGGKVRMKHGLNLLGGAGDSDPTTYVIDSDFFTDGRTEVGNALDKLDQYNREAGRLFRWAIKDRLHEAMEPDII